MSAENKRAVRRIFEDYVNEPRTELLNELFADDYVGAQSGTAPMGPAGFATTLQALREGFPDIRYSIEDLIAEGDVVAVRWQWTGTHRGVFRGPAGAFQPTGKTVSNDGIAIFHVSGGKAVRASLITDRLGFLQQIGAVPAAGVGSR